MRAWAAVSAEATRLRRPAIRSAPLARLGSMGVKPAVVAALRYDTVGAARFADAARRPHRLALRGMCDEEPDARPSVALATHGTYDRVVYDKAAPLARDMLAAPAAAYDALTVNDPRTAVSIMCAAYVTQAYLHLLSTRVHTAPERASPETYARALARARIEAARMYACIDIPTSRGPHARLYT